MAAIKEQYRSAVGTAAKAAGALGIPGAFSGGVDIAGMSGIWVTMTMSIARTSGHKIDRAFAVKLVAAIGSGAAAYIGGSKIFTMLLHAFPGAGSVAAIGFNSLLNFWFTYRVGKALSSLFDSAGFDVMDFGDLVLNVLAVLAPVPGPAEIRDAINLVASTR